jgi:NADP-dependent 3-hydroxy acid dehydrogenase YdfG
MTAPVWLITGATSGLGKTLVSCIVDKGNRVVATGRQAEQRLADLRSDSVAVVDLDISASRGDVERQVKKAWEAFGHIDILVNNAGLSAPKAIEEARYVAGQDALHLSITHLSLTRLKVTNTCDPYSTSMSSAPSVSLKLFSPCSDHKATVPLPS